jgi:hypothetical protein
MNNRESAITGENCKPVCRKFNCRCHLPHPQSPTKSTHTTPKPCLSCGSKIVDPEGLIVQGEYRPLCLSCGAAATSLDAWNNRDHLKDLLTNAIDHAVRKASCSSYDDWAALIEAVIDNPQAK